MWPCDSSAVTFWGGLGMFSVVEAMGNVGIGLLISSNNYMPYSGDYTTNFLNVITSIFAE